MLESEMLVEPLIIRDGHVRPPAAPGLGIRLTAKSSKSTVLSPVASACSESRTFQTVTLGPQDGTPSPDRPGPIPTGRRARRRPRSREPGSS